MKLDWHTPEILNNAVIEYNFDALPIIDVIDQLDELFCKHVEIRLCKMSKTYLEEMEYVIGSLKEKVFRSATIVFPYFEDIDVAVLGQIYKNHTKIDAIIVYQSKEELQVENAGILFKKEDYANSMMQKHFPKNKYIVNVDFFTESQQHNPYYNKKVCIDRQGNVKNCLMHEKTFGNISENKIADIVSRSDFKKLWFASHDKIKGIRGNELRYNILVTESLQQIAENEFEIVEKI